MTTASFRQGISVGFLPFVPLVGLHDKEGLGQQILVFVMLPESGLIKKYGEYNLMILPNKKLKKGSNFMRALIQIILRMPDMPSS